MADLFAALDSAKVDWIFMSGTTHDLLELWSRHVEWNRLLAVLHLGSEPKPLKGWWHLAWNSWFDGVTNGTWWWGTSFPSSPVETNFPSVRLLSHLLSPLHHGRLLAPTEPVSLDQGETVAWLNNFCHPGGILPARAPQMLVVTH
jgi:hypothetical protein